MNFYVDSGGAIIGTDPERVFQGSAMASTVRFIGAFPAGASVLVSYTLPDGTKTLGQLMTLNKELAGVLSADSGVTFSVWEQKLGVKFEAQADGSVKALPDYSLLEQTGNIMVHFTVVQNDNNGTPITLATAASSFICEKGAPMAMPSEAFDEYKSLLNQILAKLSQVSQENVDGGKNKVDRSGDTMTGPLVISNGLNSAKYDSGGIETNGKKLTFPDKSGTLALTEDATAANSAIKQELEQSLVGDVKLSLSGNMIVTETYNGKGSLKNSTALTLPYGERIQDVRNAAVAKINFSVSPIDYILSIEGENMDGGKLFYKTVDLPLESMVVGANYDKATNELVLTLQNGHTTRVELPAILGGIIPSSEKGAPNGVATLDESGKVPESQLPSNIGGGSGADMSEYVKFTDYPDPKKMTKGVIGIDNYYGFNVGQAGSAGVLMPLWASNAEIDSNSDRRFLNPSNLKYAVIKALTTNTNTLTDEEKAAACETIGAVAKVTDTTAYRQVYAKNADGTQFMANVHNQAIPNAFPIRDATGNFYVSNPELTYHCANKKYVDEYVLGSDAETYKNVDEMVQDVTGNNYNTLADLLAALYQKL